MHKCQCGFKQAGAEREKMYFVCIKEFSKIKRAYQRLHRRQRLTKDKKNIRAIFTEVNKRDNKEHLKLNEQPI